MLPLNENGAPFLPENIHSIVLNQKDLLRNWSHSFENSIINLRRINRLVSLDSANQ